jgi:hypothetical protein
MRPITDDPRVKASMNAAREVVGHTSAETPEHAPMTEDEIRAADDAYFERMNQRGWNG